MKYFVLLLNLLMKAIRPSRVEWLVNYEKKFLMHENISFF